MTLGSGFWPCDNSSVLEISDGLRDCANAFCREIYIYYGYKLLFIYEISSFKDEKKDCMTDNWLNYKTASNFFSHKIEKNC